MASYTTSGDTINAVLQTQVTAQPIESRLCPQLNLDKGKGADQSRIHCDDQQLNRIALHLFRLS